MPNLQVGRSAAHALGQGSRFSVTFPRHGALAAATHEATRPSEPPPPLSSNAPVSALPDKVRPVVLLADDNEVSCQVIVDYLDNKGYVVHVAGDGAAALALAQAAPPDAVLMDIQMPHMDGLEATRQMRMDPRLRGIPIIALTALAMPGDRERCLAAGADAYMTKPVSLRALLTTLQRLLDHRTAAAPPED